MGVDSEWRNSDVDDMMTNDDAEDTDGRSHRNPVGFRWRWWRWRRESLRTPGVSAVTEIPVGIYAIINSQIFPYAHWNLILL